MRPYRLAIVGAGWRTEFFLRIAAALPGRFDIAGLVVRSEAKARVLEETWPYRTYRTVEQLLEAVGMPPEFWVSSVSFAANGPVNRHLLGTGIPIFTETPPAATVEEMTELWQAAAAAGGRIQVAEQFHRQPHHAARLAAVRAGWIGKPHTAYVSLCHGYHGTSLLRRYLGVGSEEARIVGMGWTDRVLDPGGREGPQADPGIRESPQLIALLDWGDGRKGVFDFSGVQYFSPIRAQRVCVRGERGEIVDHSLSAYSEGGHGILLPFQRHVAGANGNLEGQHLKGIQLGREWIYRNPTAPARLSDEEIAMATMLEAMGEYARGGEPVYSLAEAMQDHYLGLKIREACETGAIVTATRQPWAAAVRP